MALNSGMRIYTSDKGILEHEQAEHCHAGKAFLLDGVTFTFLHPGADDVGSSNNLSCVLLVHFGKSRVLFAGDIEASAERQLIERMDASLPVTVLLAPHHGSDSSSTPKFVESFNAEHVIFAAGYRNKYGFPHSNIKARYEQHGANSYTVGETGAISMQLNRNGNVNSVTTHWSKHKRFMQ